MSERRLSDLVSVGVLTRTFPPELVDEVITGCGRTEQRHRSLPARVMAYFAIGMALHSEGSYEDVLGLLSDGLGWTANVEPIKLPSKSAIFQARARLGLEPVEALFRRVAQPLAGADSVGAWLAGRRLVAIDGTCLDVADTPVNDEYFGRPGGMKGERAAFPQARVVAVAECGTHAIFDELKVHQRRPRIVLRSKSPDLVHQEIWGHLCCHLAHRPSLNLSGARFSPQSTDHGWRHAIAPLCRRLNPTRRRRANPRVVKRKYFKWHVKRDRHRYWPQPTGPPTATILRT